MTSKGERKRRIDATLYDAVLYLSLLHQSGASQYEAVESLAENAEYFGYAAMEFRSVIADTDCGYSIFEALERRAVATPSRKLRAFLLGYVSAVKTTGSAVSYLEDAVAMLHEEKRMAGKRFLSSLSLMAEIYLVLFVAAPLFACIAFMVLGLLAGIDPRVPAGIGFIVLPLGTLLFLILLDSLEDVPVPHKELDQLSEFLSYQKKEGTDIQIVRRLKAFDARERRSRFLKHPIRYFSKHPASVFFVSLPLAVFLSIPFVQSPYLLVAVLLLGTFSPFAFFYSRKERQKRAAESAMPDLFRRLSDLISQGMPLSEAIQHTANEDKSSLRSALYRMSADILFGSSVISAFIRFASSLKLPLVNRAVIALKETSRFAVDASETLNRLAVESKTQLMMKLERRSEMSLYLAVIYLGFLVFLFVMVIMLTVFLDAMAVSSTVPAIGIGAFSVSTYETILLCSVLIHGVCSGITAGKMGDGSVLAGMKHACILFGVGILVFLITGLV